MFSGVCLIACVVVGDSVHQQSLCSAAFHDVAYAISQFWRPISPFKRIRSSLYLQYCYRAAILVFVACDLYSGLQNDHPLLSMIVWCSTCESTYLHVSLPSNTVAHITSTMIMPSKCLNSSFHLLITWCCQGFVLNSMNGCLIDLKSFHSGASVQANGVVHQCFSKTSCHCVLSCAAGEPSSIFRIPQSLFKFHSLLLPFWLWQPNIPWVCCVCPFWMVLIWSCSDLQLMSNTRRCWPVFNAIWSLTVSFGLWSGQPMISWNPSTGQRDIFLVKLLFCPHPNRKP